MKINPELLTTNFKELLELKSENEHFLLELPYFSEKHKEYTLIDLDFEKESADLLHYEFNDTILYNNYYFEQLLFTPIEENPAFSRIPNIQVEDTENDFFYEISKPSLRYLIACFSELFQNKNCSSLFLANIRGRYDEEKSVERAKHEIKRRLRRPGAYRINPRLKRKRYDIFSSPKKQSFIFKIILTNIFQVNTIKIKSNKPVSNVVFQKLNDSLLFSLGYNLSIPLMEFRYFKDQYKPIERDLPSEISSPRRIYNKKILYYYHQGLSTQNPVLQYLSFYQIIENFYYDVSNEDLIKEVKNTITSPDFSYKKLKSIETVIIKVKNWKFKEKQAIKLVLEKFLKLDDLKDILITYDPNYYESIKSKGVEFAEAPKIIESKKTIDLSSLSNRIYKVRNSLIHSKEGELIFDEKKKGIYIPFTGDEEELRREIPLIRFVAEQIIINSSKELNDANLNYDS